MLTFTNSNPMQIVYPFETNRVFSLSTVTALVSAQYDLGEIRRGEHRGRLTPGQIALITCITIAVCLALGVTAFFCFYVQKQSKKMQARYG